MIILSVLFIITAILYSSVGFGGGSTYLALMLIWDIPYYIFPVVALICNVIVVSGNSINYLKSGNLNVKLLLPYLIGSIPFVFIGASLQISKNVFELILFLILTVAGTLLFIESRSLINKEFKINEIPKIFSVLIGSIIGFFSGLIGIGGGIFLSPILFLIKAAHPKQILASASLFIFINSLFGIAGQFTKDIVFDKILNFWPLFFAVLVGGQIGNFLSIKFLSNKTLALITSLLVIFVAARMGFRILS